MKVNRNTFATALLKTAFTIRAEARMTKTKRSGRIPRRGDHTFGQRLRKLRTTRGLTQEELAQRTETSARMVCYYETQGGTPPGPVVAEFARALKISTDNLMGLSRRQTEANETMPREELRLWRRFKQVKALPARDLRNVLQLIDSLLDRYSKAS